MPQLNVYSTAAKKIKTITVSKDIFAVPINQLLMAQAVKIYLANQRIPSAKTKSRGEIKVTKAKVWRQKGTGRARHGSKNAPIFVGGAKAHGPSGQQNFQAKLTKNQKRLSLFSALSQAFKNQTIFVIDGLDKLDPKTKRFNAVFKALLPQVKTTTLALDQSVPVIARATKNLPYLTTVLAKNLTTYRVLNSRFLIFTPAGIKALENHYLS